MRRSLLLAATISLSAPAAMACSNQAEVMAHFENVKNAYLEAAPNLTPEQFPVWAGHLEVFGNEMSTLDFAGACLALDAAATELGFDVALSAAPSGGGADVQPPKSEGTDGDVVTGGGVVIGDGVTIGSGGTAGTGDQAGGTAGAGASSGQPIQVRTRPRPRR